METELFMAVLKLRYHDDHVANNNAALSNLRRNHCLLFLEQTCVAQRCSGLTMYIDLCLRSPYTHSGLLLVDSRTTDWQSLSGSSDCQSDASECGGKGKQNYCKCTHCMLCLIIMCNVAALTFYATIYEDNGCICNKCREKHVLGTASTAGSL